MTKIEGTFLNGNVTTMRMRGWDNVLNIILRLTKKLLQLMQLNLSILGLLATIMEVT